MAASVSINTSHISYDVTYTVDYSCTKPTYGVYLAIQADGSASWRFKTLRSGVTETSGSVSFSLTASEIVSEMESNGYPVGEHTATGIQVNVTPDDIDAILGGHFAETEWISIDAPYGKAGAPTSPKVAATISRAAVDLSWGAGGAGANNSVTGYDVQYQDSADGKTWPSSWTTASGSPVTATKLSVSPPATVGYYRRFRVRTRGSAGSDYYSGWVVSTNTLRRKWNAFSAWTDPTLTARSSMIRAVYLTEIQSRVNTIRTFYGLTAYSFTKVTARSTKIARWASLIQEMRTAIDGITTSHAAWNTLEAGKPRIAHITQLRSIIDSL